MELRSTLHALAAEPTNVTPRRVWQAMAVEERMVGLQAVLERGDKRRRADVVGWLADVRKFRPQTVATWPVEKLAQVAATHQPVDAGLIREAYTHFHLRARQAMLTAFLDSVGIAHQDGAIADNGDSLPPLDDATVSDAADTLAARFPLEEVVLYFLCLLEHDSAHAFSALADWLREQFPLVPGTVAVSPSPVTSDPAPVPVPQFVDGFTTLDRHMVLTVVDVVGRVDGAPSEDDLDDMINELLHMNGRRHQSYFHAGFRDVLYGRELAISSQAENESRRRWYWAGCVSGLARENRWERIVQLFDQEPAVRGLGTTHPVAGPVETAGWLVFRALCHAERYSEATALLTQEAVAQSHTLQWELLREATELIRRNRASDARGMLRLAWSYCEGERRAQREVDPRLYRDVKRRWALCLRQLGELEEARVHLTELARDSDPVMRAIALTDIGLIKAGMGRLGDLVVPHEVEEQKTFAAALGRGESDFLDALSTPQFSSGHASFAYGVLLLVRGDYRAAIPRLDGALTFFEASREVYERDGTLALAQLYLGLAICNTLEDPGRLPRACELLRTGLAAGAAVPLSLVTPTIEALALVRDDLATQTAEDILAAAGAAALDRILDSTRGLTSAAITSALFRRAAHPSLPTSARAADYRRVLPMLLQQGDIDRARDALEFLEEAAADGVGRDEFLQLLDNQTRYDPAWKTDRALAARIYLHEVDGQFEQAAALLGTECYRVLARDDEYALDQALLSLGQLESYGPIAEETVARLAPIIEERESKRTSQDAENGQIDETPVRILVVGGNEVQARMDVDISERLHAEHPYIDVSFLHTGWSGNWRSYAEDFARSQHQYDGVVFLAYMRTMLGRTMRAQCTLPWAGCGRAGQGAIIQAILRVMPAAQHHVRSQVRRPQGAELG